MDFYTILIIGHIIGTILGVGGATLAEINIITALKDGRIDASEKALMHANYRTIRIGTAIIILSGILMVWMQYNLGNTPVLTDPKLLFKDTLVILIIINAFLLTKRWVPLWLGSAISFTAWWSATVLGLWKTQPFGYIELAIGFIIITLAVAGILELIRKWFIPKKN